MSELIVSPSQLTTILGAVNAMIFTLGETGVDSLDPIPNSDVGNALAVLDQTDLLVQSEGWHWNREADYWLPRATDGTIPLPDQTLSVTTAYRDGRNATVDVVMRGPRLYDRVNHTRDFTATAPDGLKADLIVRLPWDEIPQVTRMFITLEACTLFHAAMQERSILLRVNETLKARARATMEQQEDEWARHNVLESNSHQTSLGAVRRNRLGGI